MRWPWQKKEIERSEIPIKTFYQQMKESGVLELQQEQEDKYWDRYIEEQAQKGFREQISAKTIRIGDKDFRMPILFIPDLPSRLVYMVYDYENPTGRYMHKDPRELAAKRMSELIKEYDSSHNNKTI